MVIVPAGQNLPFEYTAFDLSVGLFVAMKVYETTSGSPIFVSTLPMTHAVNGTYLAFFSPTAGSSYLVNKMVYTSGAFTTPSNLYSPGSESFFAETPPSAVTPTDIINIVNGVWNANLSAHTTAGTMGAAENLIPTIQTKTTNLPSDPASQAAIASALTPIAASALAGSIAAAAIKVKTDNLPPDPASLSAVSAIPTNPLLTTDTRLNRLDATVSSRAAASAIAPLATSSDVTTAENAILAAITAVDNDVLTRATTSDVNAAAVPLAKQVTLLAVKSDVEALPSGELTAAQVWAYVPRSLTVPVATTIDLTPIAKTTDVTGAQATILTALHEFDVQMVAAVDPSLDILTIQVWLEEDSTAITNPQTAQVTVYNDLGNAVLSLASSSPSAQGIFAVTQATASATLLANKAYTVKTTIVRGINTYVSTQPFLVF